MLQREGMLGTTPAEVAVFLAKTQVWGVCMTIGGGTRHPMLGTTPAEVAVFLAKTQVLNVSCLSTRRSAPHVPPYPA